MRTIRKTICYKAKQNSGNRNLRTNLFITQDRIQENIMSQFLGNQWINFNATLRLLKKAILREIPPYLIISSSIILAILLTSRPQATPL
jgi:hypothetical protein